MISIKAARRVFKKAGAKRISKNAIIVLKKILERKGGEIAKEAVKNASYAGRIVVKAEDVIEKGEE